MTLSANFSINLGLLLLLFSIHKTIKGSSLVYVIYLVKTVGSIRSPKEEVMKLKSSFFLSVAFKNQVKALMICLKKMAITSL